MVRECPVKSKGPNVTFLMRFIPRARFSSRTTAGPNKKTRALKGLGSAPSFLFPECSRPRDSGEQAGLLAPGSFYFPFPSHPVEPGSGYNGISSPVTAAGPRRPQTGFPIKLEEHLSRSGYPPCPSKSSTIPVWPEPFSLGREILDAAVGQAPCLPRNGGQDARPTRAWPATDIISGNHYTLGRVLVSRRFHVISSHEC